MGKLCLKCFLHVSAFLGGELFVKVTASSLGGLKPTTSCIAASCPKPVYQLQPGNAQNRLDLQPPTKRACSFQFLSEKGWEDPVLFGLFPVEGLVLKHF